MEETISFVDRDCEGEGLAAIRAVAGGVSLRLELQDDRTTVVGSAENIDAIRAAIATSLAEKISPPGLTFNDVETGDEVFACVKWFSDGVAIVLSLRHGGDIQVVVAPEVALQIEEALSRAVSADGNGGKAR
jgi:hypothetical protein